MKLQSTEGSLFRVYMLQKFSTVRGLSMATLERKRKFYAEAIDQHMPKYIIYI